MISNFLKIAWRNLFRNKGFSVTNILGLSIGMICTILILLWVQDELTFNKFHANYDHIYKVIAHRDFNNQIFTDENMVLPLAKAIETGSPQVKNAVVTTHRQSFVITYADTRLKQMGYIVSEHFFDLFSWRFVKGNATTALNDPSSIILTESASKALFGTGDPLDKTVRINNNHEAKVAAIVADPPSNSTLLFDCIMPFNYSDKDVKHSMTQWQNSSWNVYVQTVPGANMGSIEKSINEIKQQHDPGDKKISTYFAFPMNKWRLYADFKDGKNVGGMIEYVRLFTIIAFIILLIACVNFMNLSTSRSEKRAKEIGVRKTLGSYKNQIILQFFFESLILAFIAFIIAVIAVFLLMPAFNILVSKQLSLDLTRPLFWFGSFLIIVLTGIIAGSYPALYLSSFNPVKVLKGAVIQGKSASMPRLVLVVAQFSISMLLISATIIVYKQIEHIRNRDMGYNPNNLLAIAASPDVNKNFVVIKQELLKTGVITAVTRTMAPITEIWWKSPAPDWDGKPSNANIIMTGVTTDIDFSKTMGIKMLLGNDFSGTPSDSSAMLLNNAAVMAMGLKNPIGTQMRYGGQVFTVIGITDNVIMDSPFKAVDPMMIYYNPGNSNSMSVRIAQSADLQKTLQSIETIFKKYDSSVPFEFQFVDQEFNKKFVNEELISRIANIFAGLAIFICCMGLAGLASFTIEKRFREIGIRKVLGATVQQLLMLISREFLKLVIIAFVISVPITWFFMYNWLQKYTFRIQIDIWIFIAVGIIILLLTLVVVSLNTIRAAIANPVKSLRTE